MTLRSLPARIAVVEQRAGIKHGLAMLTDDELVLAIEALRRIEAAQADGAVPDPADVALAERAVSDHYRVRQRDTPAPARPAMSRARLAGVGT